MLFTRRRLLNNITTKQEILPRGYIQLDWIESTGTQYIDTGIYMKTTYGIEVKQETTGTGSRAIMGARSSFVSKAYSIFSIYESNRKVIRYDMGNQVSYPNLQLNTPYVIKRQGLDNYCNDIQVQSNIIDSDFTCEFTAFLFSVSTRGVPNESTNFIGKIYYFTITDENNVVIQNLIPCYSIVDNEIGMFDTVTNTFFRNQGTGEFLRP